MSTMTLAPPIPIAPPMPKLELRAYQRDAIAAVDAARAAGRNAALLVMSTGTGKTIVFDSIIQRWGVRSLVLAHRQELLTQARDKLLTVWPEADVGIVGGGYDEPGHAITVASVQSASHPRRLRQLATAGIELLVIDEAHHCPANTYLRVIEELRAGKPGGPFLLGCTATPQRKDALSLATVFGAPVYVATLPAMIADGWLTDLRGIQVRTTTRLDGVHTRAGDFAADELADAVDTTVRNEQIVQAWQTHAADRQTIVFAASVAHAYALAEAFNEAGTTAAALDGETPREERRRILTDFAAGRLQVVCNMGVLTEGYDQPAVACIILARPTKSQSLYIQMAGRGARPAPGKRDCLIIDVVDMSARHKLVQLPDLVGGAYPKRQSQPPAVRGDGIREEEPAQFSLLRAVAGPTTVSEVSLVKSWPWQRDGAAYCLAVGEGSNTARLVLLPDGQTGTRYTVWRADPGRTASRLSPQALPLGWAQAVAEQSADLLEQGQAHLVDRSAPWRRTPASEKQLDLLRKYRVPFASTITKGEASDLLQVTFARQAARRGA